MSIIRLISRCAETAIKLPVAAAWDVISLGNMGDGSSTGKVLQEHVDKAYLDECVEVAERLRELSGGK